jgi:hypothetical protein
VWCLKNRALSLSAKFKCRNAEHHPGSKIRVPPIQSWGSSQQIRVVDVLGVWTLQKKQGPEKQKAVRGQGGGIRSRSEVTKMHHDQAQRVDSERNGILKTALIAKFEMTGNSKCASVVIVSDYSASVAG